MAHATPTVMDRSIAAPHEQRNQKLLFWACFIALVATAFGFIVRALIIDDWAMQFGLSETQKGEIFGVGLWPFAVSIVLFSLVVDRIGYGKAMVFAFLCHITSAILTIMARGYWHLYVAMFIAALGNGTVEAVINPVVATLFPREKTKWLNILHAGWPGGLVLGGVIALMMGPDADWRYKVALVFIPVVLYAVLMLGRRFPVHERVAAGVSYKEMLAEPGILGALVVSWLIVFEVGRVFDWSMPLQIAVIVALTGGYGAYVRSIGRPMFIFLLLIMIPLATTELGTDSWITDLMKPEMQKLGLQAGWVLVYTSLIMMILRFLAGPIVHKLSPLGLLAVSAALAAVGLVALSKSAGMGILLAATLYGFGKTFFWPTMLGVVSEQFPKGGALTLNTIGGVGMLSVGVVGTAFLGYSQDTRIDRMLASKDAALHGRFIGDEKRSVFGSYRPLDNDRLNEVRDKVGLFELRAEHGTRPEGQAAAKWELAVQNAFLHLEPKEPGKDATAEQMAAYQAAVAAHKEAASSHESRLAYIEGHGLLVDEAAYAALKEDKALLEGTMAEAKKSALTTVAIFPCIMLVCYLALIAYFRARGGYKAQVLTGHVADDEKFTGGVTGPVEA